VSIRNRGPKDQLHLRMRRTSGRNDRTPMQLKMENRIFASMTGALDILEGPATAQAQERGPDSLGTRSIGASVPVVLKKLIKWIGTR
jgi:hypothetical protein